MWSMEKQGSTAAMLWSGSGASAGSRAGLVTSLCSKEQPRSTRRCVSRTCKMVRRKDSKAQRRHDHHPAMLLSGILLVA